MSESFTESEPAPPSSALPAFVTKNRLNVVEEAELPVVAVGFRNLVDDSILSKMDTPDPRKWGSALHLRRPAVAGGEWDVHIRRRSLASSDDSEPSETSRSREIEIQLIDKQGGRGEYAHYRLDERHGAVRCLDSVTLDEKAARYKPDLFEVGNSEPGSVEMEAAVEALTEEIGQAPQRPQSETGIDPDSRIVGSNEMDGLAQFITEDGWYMPSTQEMIKKIWEEPSE
jgi:hypothetical protein